MFRSTIRSHPYWSILGNLPAALPPFGHRHSRNVRLVLQYSACIDHGWSIFYNTCTSFAPAGLARHRSATIYRVRSNLGNLIFPGYNNSNVVFQVFLSRWNLPFLFLLSVPLLLSGTYCVYEKWRRSGSIRRSSNSEVFDSREKFFLGLHLNTSLFPGTLS